MPGSDNPCTQIQQVVSDDFGCAAVGESACVNSRTNKLRDKPEQWEGCIREWVRRVAFEDHDPDQIFFDTQRQTHDRRWAVRLAEPRVLVRHAPAAGHVFECFRRREEHLGVLERRFFHGRFERLNRRRVAIKIIGPADRHDPELIAPQHADRNARTPESPTHLVTQQRTHGPGRGATLGLIQEFQRLAEHDLLLGLTQKRLLPEERLEPRNGQCQAFKLVCMRLAVLGWN